MSIFFTLFREKILFDFDAFSVSLLLETILLHLVASYLP